MLLTIAAAGLPLQLAHASYPVRLACRCRFLLHPLSCPEDSAVLGSIVCLLNLLMLPPSVSGSGCGRQGVVKWVTMTVLEDHSPVLQQLVVGGADTADDKGSRCVPCSE